MLSHQKLDSHWTGWSTHWNNKLSPFCRNRHKVAFTVCYVEIYFYTSVLKCYDKGNGIDRFLYSCFSFYANTITRTHFKMYYIKQLAFVLCVFKTKNRKWNTSSHIKTNEEMHCILINKSLFILEGGFDENTITESAIACLTNLWTWLKAILIYSNINSLVISLKQFFHFEYFPMHHI